VNSGANGSAVTAVANAGYQFINWSDAGTANPRTDTDVLANITITANFAVILGTGSVVTSGGGGGGGGGGNFYNPYTIIINGGARQTASANVTLALTSLAGIDQMWISNDLSFATSTGTGWIPFQPSYPWTFPFGSGDQTVYAEFGNASTSTPAGNAEASIIVGAATGDGGATFGTLHAAQVQLLNLLIAELKSILQQAQAQGVILPPGAAEFLNE
jgi:hypothetical protein